MNNLFATLAISLLLFFSTTIIAYPMNDEYDEIESPIGETAEPDRNRRSTAIHTGDVTFYTSWNQGYGSCGLAESMRNPYMVGALSTKWMSNPLSITNPNNKKLCKPEHCVQIKGPRGVVNVKISDTCEGCKDQDVDVADSIYEHLASKDEGRVRMQWKFVNCATHRPGKAHPNGFTGRSRRHAAASTYSVQSGDTCWSIWTSNGLTQSQFRELNPNIECDSLEINQKVRISGGST